MATRQGAKTPHAREHDGQGADAALRPEPAVTAFIAGYLVQDGLASGALYTLLALAIVLVFALTRVVLIPQGEFVSYAALTYALLIERKTPGTIFILLLLVALTIAVEAGRGLWHGDLGRRLIAALRAAIFPLAAAALTYGASRVALPAIAYAAVAVVLVAALGPLLYRLVYEPIAQASVLVLLIVSVAAHLVLVELGLFVFGPGGARTEPLIGWSLSLGGVPVGAQSLAIYAVTAIVVLVLYLLSERTLYGKALRAAAINATGARLMGISAATAGRVAFLLAATIGAITGVLVSSVTMIYYDTGFLLGLKGFVAAIMGGLVSYPLAAIGAIGLGVMESFAAYFASAFKEAIVFSLIIPILFWRSLATFRLTDDEE
jgi:branched-subunit amino acid ABC-type transport system permease component